MALEQYQSGAYEAAEGPAPGGSPYVAFDRLADRIISSAGTPAVKQAFATAWPRLC